VCAALPLFLRCFWWLVFSLLRDEQCVLQSLPETNYVNLPMVRRHNKQKSLRRCLFYRFVKMRERAKKKEGKTGDTLDTQLVNSESEPVVLAFFRSDAFYGVRVESMRNSLTFYVGAAPIAKPVGTPVGSQAAVGVVTTGWSRPREHISG
jgi:hypothetical protein